MRRVLKSIDVREGLFAHDVVLAKPAAGTGYCGSEIVTALEPMEGGGLQFCDYVRTCTRAFVIAVEPVVGSHGAQRSPPRLGG
jgi:hypothetical protein